VLYARWRADELTVGRVGATPRVREPPHIVFNDRGQVFALGLEAAEAAKQSGAPLIRLTSFEEVQHNPSAAAKLLFFLTMAAWSTDAHWSSFAARLFPFWRPSLIVHFVHGAESGLSPDAADPFIRHLRRYGVRRVFLWAGEDLDTYALRGAAVRGQWIGRAPRRAWTSRRT
jgi:hypothetical protein